MASCIALLQMWQRIFHSKPFFPLKWERGKIKSHSCWFMPGLSPLKPRQLFSVDHIPKNRRDRDTQPPSALFSWQSFHLSSLLFQSLTLILKHIHTHPPACLHILWGIQENNIPVSVYREICSLTGRFAQANLLVLEEFNFFPFTSAYVLHTHFLSCSISSAIFYFMNHYICNIMMQSTSTSFNVSRGFHPDFPSTLWNLLLNQLNQIVLSLESSPGRQGR